MKKPIIIFIIIILIAISYSCKAKINTVETHSTDTIRIEKIVRITPAQINSLKIDSPCDSLGNLKPFFYTLYRGKDKLIVKTIDNNIYIEQNLDSIKEVWLKEQQKSTFTSDKMDIIYKTPNWNWKIMLIMLITIVLLWKFK